MSQQLWRAQVVVTLKPVVNDPQGLSIRGGLQQLGYHGVESVRAGKYLEITLRATDRPDAERQVAEMASRLLANPVIEDFKVTITAVQPTAQPGAPAGR